MSRKPKKLWQVAVITKLHASGMSYAELAGRINESYDCVRQVMCKDNMPGLRKKICDYLNIDLERLMEDEQKGIS